MKSFPLASSPVRIALSLVPAVLVVLCLTGPAGAITFTPYGPEAGISVTGELSEFGHGVCAFDLEGDGDLDLYVTNGVGSPSQLFINDGGFVFTEAAGALGASDSGHAKAAVAADYDNDGDPDLYVTHYGEPNRLYRNDGGAFVDVAPFANVMGDTLFSTGAAWTDFDNDGLLDLYVTNRGITTAGEPNLLYRNDGDGTFTEVAVAMGVECHTMTFQPIFTDYDLDGDPDLYISSDKFQGNRLYRNEGGVSFTDVSAETNSGLLMDGMGISVGDVNDDGRPDIYITNTPYGHRCLVSQPDATFLEMADTLGMTVGEIGWGAVFFDCDLDGDEDLFQVNEAPNRLFRNDGGAPWPNITSSAGVAGTALSLGCTAADFDEDGDLDIYVSNIFYECEIYRNETMPGVHWLKVKTEGTVSNRDGIGARVEIEISGDTQFREIRAGSSYLSQEDMRACFGLGSATTVDLVEIRWPSGIVDVLQNVAADQVLTVVEGSNATSVAAGSGTESIRVGRMSVSPNPFRYSLAIEADLRQPASLVLRVMNITGREVYREDLGTRSAGRLTARWNGRDVRGESVPPGVYWLHLEQRGDNASRANLTRKVTVLR